MRRSTGRLAAAAVAIAIGTAFVAATLLAGGVLRQISTGAITAAFGSADLVALTSDVLTDQMVQDVRALPGVAGADPQLAVQGVEIGAGSQAITQTVVPVASDQAFDTQQVTAGAMPVADDEISLPERAAERLGVTVGDQVTASYSTWPPDGATAVRAQQTLTVTGLTTDPRSAWASSDGAAQASTADTLLWSGWSSGTGGAVLADAQVHQLKVAVTSGADAAAVQDAVAAALDADSTMGVPTQVLTLDTLAERRLSDDGTGPVTVVVLSFAAVALLVAGLVIANTFQVLVAQRTRTLALLRCVGAVRGQVRRSVLLEAALLGAAASTAGLVLGTALVQATLLALQNVDLSYPVPSTVRLTVAAVVAPLAVGVGVTVLAALSPARAATRVAPVAALRPAGAAQPGSRAGRVRLTLGLLLAVGGGLLLVGGVRAGERDAGAGLVIAVLGGALSFVGLLVTAVRWMPPVVAGLGRLIGRLGVPARLATANTGRNPARTAATSTALLIGVTLVAMMSTGAATARASLDDELDTRYPVDLSVAEPDVLGPDGTSTAQALPASTLARLAAVDGVAAAVPVTTGDLVVGGTTVSAEAVTVADASAVLRDADLASAMADGTLTLPTDLATDLGLADGDQVPVALADPSTGAARAGSPTIELRVARADLRSGTALVTPATLDDLGSDAPAGTAWLRLVDPDDAGAVVQRVQDVTADQTLDITGSAVERATFQRAIDTMLAVVIGLLAVAVVIALVGVTNTLSLSVIERRRESATLRALGLTRRALRASMAVEGTLIAGTGAVVGVLLGLVYGWAGSIAVLGSIGTVELRVPWAHLGLALAIAVLAGVVASVLPGRSAARTPPVAALAEA
ncbi:MAG TPA: FtsX-like permease family protein [Cellulomonas sp.]